MKIIVFSDTHGVNYGMKEVLKLHSNADLFLHLGDGAPDFVTLCQGWGKPYAAVKGNCDFCSDLPLEMTLNLMGKTVFLTHGHDFGVKHSLGSLRRRGKEVGADIILFGHTHTPVIEYCSEDEDKPYYLLNPGTLGRTFGLIPSTYGVIEIKGNNLLVSHGKLM